MACGNFWQKPENAFFWCDFKVLGAPVDKSLPFLLCFIYGIFNIHTKFKVSKLKTVGTGEWSRQGSKYSCLQSLKSKLYFTKIFLKNSFWRHLPSTMF
jgi:hypothetical protein